MIGLKGVVVQLCGDTLLSLASGYDKKLENEIYPV